MDTYIVIVGRGEYEDAVDTIEAVVHNYQDALMIAEAWRYAPPPVELFGDEVNWVSLEHWHSGQKCCADYFRHDGEVDTELFP